MELLKDPVPEPLDVLVLKAIVGLDEVLLQHTPFDEILAPPSDVIDPPLEADVVVILVAVVVVKVGRRAVVVSENSFE